MSKEDLNNNYFNELNKVNCEGHIEKKNGLDYLAWAFAWGELKKRYPTANYTVYESIGGLNYHTDGRTAWVKVGVTVEGIEHIEYLPVMDYRNASIPVDKITSFDVNKTTQRAITKCIARHGLGLSLYGYDFTDTPDNAETATASAETPATKTVTVARKKKTAVNTDEALQLARARYQELIAYCQEHNKNIKAVASAFGLNSKSSAEDFSTALSKLIYADAKAKQAEAVIDEAQDVPFEV